MAFLLLISGLLRLLAFSAEVAKLATIMTFHSLLFVLKLFLFLFRVERLLLLLLCAEGFAFVALFVTFCHHFALELFLFEPLQQIRWRLLSCRNTIPGTFEWPITFR